MLNTTAVETATAYIFTVTDGKEVFVYEWGKEPPEGQTIDEYLQTCKREAELIATDEIVRMQPPTVIQL